MSTKDEIFTEDDVSPHDPRDSNEKPKKLNNNELDKYISIDFIEKELMELPPENAWEVFRTLNELLSSNETWRRYDIGIRNKLKDRLLQKSYNQSRMMQYMEKVASEPKVQNNIYAQEGSTTNVSCNIDQNQFTILDKEKGLEA